MRLKTPKHNDVAAGELMLQPRTGLDQTHMFLSAGRQIANENAVIIDRAAVQEIVRTCQYWLDTIPAPRETPAPCVIVDDRLDDRLEG